MSSRAEIAEAGPSQACSRPLPALLVKRMQARAREPEEDSSQCTRREASGGPQGNPAGLGSAQDHTQADPGQG